MTTLFKPPAGIIEFKRGYDDPKKILVSQNPRAFMTGSMLWLNKVSGRYQAEPANVSAQSVGTDYTAGTSNPGDSTSVAHAGGVFAALFLGIAAESRIPQQLNTLGQFYAGGATSATVMDASKPFITYYDKGIFSFPVGPTLSATGLLTSAVDPGTYVTPDGFTNEGTTGFYDSAGQLCKDTDNYLYNNCVNTTATAADGIAIVVERAEIGSPILICEVKSYVLNIALG